MPIAAYFFFAAILLGLICGFRINVRAFQWMEGRRTWPQRPAWDPIHLILGIKLRNTFGLEVLGFAVAILTIVVAIQFLKPSG